MSNEVPTRDVVAQLIYDAARQDWLTTVDGSANASSYAAADALLESEVFARIVADAAERLNEVERVPCTCGYGGFHEPLNKRCERTQAAAGM